MRTTGMTDTSPFGIDVPCAGVTIALGVMQSSSTGVGSPTSQSSSSIISGRPISRDTILRVISQSQFTMDPMLTDPSCTRSTTRVSSSPLP